jgi:hypothetical protein
MEESGRVGTFIDKCKFFYFALQFLKEFKVLNRYVKKISDLQFRHSNRIFKHGNSTYCV